MGSSGSIAIKPEHLTSEDVAEFVSSLGPAYEVYSRAIIDNNVNGLLLVEVKSDEVLTDILDDLGIKRAVHKTAMFAYFKKLSSGDVSFFI